MPAEPKTLSQTVDSHQGAIDQTVYFAKVGGVLFTAQVLRLPEAAMRGTPEAILLDVSFLSIPGAARRTTLRLASARPLRTR